jgi:hypothetical protein
MLGLPRQQRNDRSALTLLALLNMKRSSRWSKATTVLLRVHDILLFAKSEYDKTYAENSRETFRRQTLHQFEQAGLVIRNPDDPNRPTNSGKTVYAISPEALYCIQAFGSTDWDDRVLGFIQRHGVKPQTVDVSKVNTSLLRLPSGKLLRFSPGKHNELQGLVMSSFVPRFCPSAELLYIGDTSNKILYLQDEKLRVLGCNLSKHDKLPDIVLHDSERNRLLIIEVVTSHGPVSQKRLTELEMMLTGSNAERVYLSVFPSFAEFKKHAASIAWDTEVWIAEVPEHIVHFNGPKFFSPRGG